METGSEQHPDYAAALEAELIVARAERAAAVAELAVAKAKEADDQAIGRPEDEFGGRPGERELIVRLHATKEDVPQCGLVIDATAPLAVIVDGILLKMQRGRPRDPLGSAARERR
ncbi:hypothetical protein WGT02_08165 [Rhizobium sp. T1470]|uniref:hypothetical protein n=1 Tax=unclassified Rhizobium TaxID=2613769 RepID=UPI001CD6B436|nr:hypothetical protein [Rhizobium sp. T1473]MCA0801255.1 hypothetical protein [Rhizobium sp. T1473]